MQKERKIITYQEIAAIPSSEIKESLVDVRKYEPSIIAQYEKNDMFPYTGERIFVRDRVARKLAIANRALAKNGKFRFRVVSGYRHPDIQEEYFKQKRTDIQKSNPSLNDEELDTLTHNFIAVPSVAGHPTGGAIDITIVDAAGNDFDMGTQIVDFENIEKIKTFAKGLSNKQKRNRLFLRDILVREGFAPFYGEWWHFSYGDLEWACFYGKKKSIYSPLKFKLTQKN